MATKYLDSGNTRTAVVNDARSVHLVSGMDARGNYPTTWFLEIADEAADVNDNTVVYESGDVSMYNHHEFTIYQAPGAGAVEVFITHDGTNYEATPIQVISDGLVVGAVIQSANEMTAIGNYYFDRKVYGWKLQNKGATTGAVTKIRGSHTVV